MQFELPPIIPNSNIITLVVIIYITIIYGNISYTVLLVCLQTPMLNWNVPNPITHLESWDHDILVLNRSFFNPKFYRMNQIVV